MAQQRVKLNWRGCLARQAIVLCQLLHFGLAVQRVFVDRSVTEQVRLLRQLFASLGLLWGNLVSSVHTLGSNLETFLFWLRDKRELVVTGACGYSLAVVRHSYCWLLAVLLGCHVLLLVNRQFEVVVCGMRVGVVSRLAQWTICPVDPRVCVAVALCALEFVV